MSDTKSSKNGSNKKREREYKLPEGVYCGADFLPKDKKRFGNLMECHSAGQVRLWNKKDYLTYTIMGLETQKQRYKHNLDIAKRGKMINFFDEYSKLYKMTNDLLKKHKKELEDFNHLYAYNMSYLQSKNEKILSKLNNKDIV